MLSSEAREPTAESSAEILGLSRVAVLVPCYNEEAAIGLAIPIFVTYLQKGIVPRLPTAVLSTGLMVPAFLSITCGIILDTVTRGRRELKLLAYLAQRAPAEERRRR